MKNNELKLHYWCIYDSHKAKNANWDTYDSIESFKKIQQVVVNSELSFKKAEHSWRLRGAWACTGKQVDSLWKIIKGNNTGRITGMTDPQKKPLKCAKTLMGCTMIDWRESNKYVNFCDMAKPMRRVLGNKLWGMMSLELLPPGAAKNHTP